MKVNHILLCSCDDKLRFNAKQIYLLVTVHISKCFLFLFTESSIHGMSFLDVLLSNALAAGLAHDHMRQANLRPPPENYFVLSKDPQVWKQFKEDSRKENLVVCMEFIDEDMSSTVFVDLAREFDSIPFVRVQVGQGVEGSFEEAGFVQLSIL